MTGNEEAIRIAKSTLYLNKNLSYYGLEGKRLIIKQDGSDISNLEKFTINLSINI